MLRLMCEDMERIELNRMRRLAAAKIIRVENQCRDTNTFSDPAGRQQFHRDSLGPRFTTHYTYKICRFIEDFPMFSAQDF